MDIPPDECVEFLRGIRNDEDFDGTGFDHSVFSSGFQVLNIEELHGWAVTSINWDLPDGDALGQLLSQTNPKKNDEIQFKFGAIRIPREKLDQYIKRYKSKLDYEIRVENGNEYHGHILLSTDLEKKRKQTICTFLANAFIEIHKQENQNA